MCYKCHLGLSNDNIKEQLMDALIKKNFDDWTTTTLSHMFIIGSGMNGNVNKKLAIILIEQYIDFLKIQPDNYFPKNGLEKMYPVDKIMNVLTYIKSHKYINDINNINNIFNNQ
jgi:hypothetical protein